MDSGVWRMHGEPDSLFWLRASLTVGLYGSTGFRAWVYRVRTRQGKLKWRTLWESTKFMRFVSQMTVAQHSSLALQNGSVRSGGLGMQVGWCCMARMTQTICTNKSPMDSK